MQEPLIPSSLLSPGKVASWIIAVLLREPRASCEGLGDRGVKQKATEVQAANILVINKQVRVRIQMFHQHSTAALT